MKVSKVSIILTTHGPAPYLKQAIGSVLAQTFEDWELWITVDGVLDGLKYWTTNEFGDDRIQIACFTVPNVSCRFAHTINQVFKYARGEYITYLCHDDLYLPWRLELMTKFMEDKNWDVCFGHQQLFTQTEVNRGFMGGGGMNNNQTRIGNPDQPAGTVDHSSVMHRRECFEKAGGWDENCPPRYGDAYFWMRLQNAGYKFHCIPEVLDCHRFNRESITWKEDHENRESCV